MKKKIGKIGEQRQKLRESKSRSKIPTVAVVGYTNCGKTSLIKALTGKCLMFNDTKQIPKLILKV